MKAFVLLSGGVDSTTCLYLAKTEFSEVEGVSIDYGQRHMKELEYAKRSCDALGCEHHIIEVKGVVPKTMLTDPKAKVPKVSYDQLKGVSPTYVPYRNGLMLSALTSYVAGEWGKNPQDGEWGIYFGAHAEDAARWAYPDCTPEFIGAMANAIFIGTYHGVRLHTPLQWLGKSEIILLGERLRVDWTLTWSCYQGWAKHCGVCPTCRARKDGFKKARVPDPTIYA